MAAMSARPDNPTRHQESAGPRFEAVVHRSIDGETEFTLYVDGQPCEVVEYEVDPGRGHTSRDWQETRDYYMSVASATARAHLSKLYDEVRPILIDAHGGSDAEGGI